MSTLLHPLRSSWLALLAAAACLVSSCGGGVGDQASNTGSGSGSGVGSGGTGSYTNGPISGLGSIIVNGVRYDVSAAKVLSDDGSVVLTGADLVLGMQVEVSSGAITPAAATGELPTAVASEVRFASALVGPVSAVPDAECSCLMVLGQKVTYTLATNMPKSLSVNEVVEVFGQPDLANGKRVLVATRVQRVTSPILYKLVGWVASQASVNAGAHTLTVQGPSSSLVISFTDAQAIQVNALVDDDAHRRPVRVWMTGSMSALALDHLSVDHPLVSDRDEATLEGRVTAELLNGHMAVNGSVVDVSALTGEALTQAGRLVVGDRVRLEGRLADGVLRVTELHGEHDDEGIELHGWPTDIQPVGADMATMLVRRVTVIYQPSAAPTNLGEQMCIEVEGERYDAEGRLVATTVKQDDSCRSEEDDD